MVADRSGIAATEFAIIVPLMLVMFFGTVEFSSGVAVDRKVTLMARTLSESSIVEKPAAKAPKSVHHSLHSAGSGETFARQTPSRNGA